MNKSTAKRLWALVFILFIVAGLGFGQEKKYQFSIFSGIQNIFEYGSVEDYSLGENDFPVTPAHRPSYLGASVAFFLTHNIAIECNGKYILPSKVTLEDPSDGDTIEIDTYKHYSLSLNLIYQFLSGRFRPYLALGGGVDKQSAEDETYISEFGFEVTFIAPDKTIHILAQAGGGIEYFISTTSGIMLDVRYVMIFSDPNNIKSLNASLGFFSKF